MIDEISTDLKTSEKSEADVTASEGPSVEDVAKAFGGSLDGVSVVSTLVVCMKLANLSRRNLHAKKG